MRYRDNILQLQSRKYGDITNIKNEGGREQTSDNYYHEENEEGEREEDNKKEWIPRSRTWLVFVKM